MDVKIERLGLMGDGIAAGPIYVPRALPGEVVSGDIEGQRMNAPRVLEPSGARIKAVCPHYNACGGCALMHAREDFVATWKREAVAQALAAQGIEAEVLAPMTSGAGTRRRAVLSGRRTKKGALVGFHGRASDQITPIPDCVVLHPDLVAAIPSLEEMTRLAASRSSEVRYHMFVGDTGIDLAVTGAKPLDGPLRAELARFGSDFARVTWAGETVLLAAAPGVRFGTARIEPPAGAFLQATPEGEAALVAHALKGIAGAKRVVDLFAGCGTFTFPAAARATVHAVEGDQPLIDALDHGVRHNKGFKPITSEQRDLFRNPVIAEDLARFDAAIIDPPRAGAEAQTREMAQARIPRISSISCNPVTFARDALILIDAGYRLGPVQVVDQFRWSPHIELAATLSLEKS